MNRIRFIERMPLLAMRLATLMLSQGDAEYERLGGTHADLGSYLLGLWQLPPEILQATMYHHYELGVLLSIPNLKREALIINLSAALAGIDPTLDDFTYHDTLEKTFDRYRALPFDGISTLNVEHMYDRVSLAVNAIKEMFKTR